MLSSKKKIQQHSEKTAKGETLLDYGCIWGCLADRILSGKQQKLTLADYKKILKICQQTYKTVAGNGEPDRAY